MNKNYVLFLLFVLFFTTNGWTAKWKSAFESLIRRVMKEQADHFWVEPIPTVDGRDIFEIENVRGKVVLRGNSPVAVASALNWYSKIRACFLYIIVLFLNK